MYAARWSIKLDRNCDRTYEEAFSFIQAGCGHEAGGSGLLSVSKVGQWLPTTSADYSNRMVTVTCTTSTSHHCAHTRSSSSRPNKVCSTQPHCSSQLAPWSYLCCLALPLCLPAVSAQQLGLWHWCIQSSTAVPGRRQKTEKAWIITMHQERDAAACFPARGGNWTSNIRTGFCSHLSLCHCAAGHHTGEMHVGSW